MKITIDIPDDDVRAVLEHFKANLPAWCVELYADEVALVSRLFGKGWHVEVRRERLEDPLEHSLDLERGLRMMLIPGCYWGAQCIQDWGPDACDAFVQYAAFGELRYG